MRGIGAFLGDFFFYPTPMFVSLVTHGLQAVVISLCAHHLFQKKPMIGAGIGVLLGAVIMVVGYSLGRAFIYGTVEYALLKLPFQILQAAVGAIVAMVLCFAWGLALRFDKICGCNLVRRTEKGRLRRRGWGLRWEKAQKGGKGTNLRGFFED